MTQQHNLTIPQGTTWGVAWPVVDQSGNPVDLTGWSARSQVRPAVDSETVLYEWTSADESIELTGSRVTLRITPSTSTAWTWRDGVYDVELTNPDQTVYRIASGRVTVTPEVTR